MEALDDECRERDGCAERQEDANDLERLELFSVQEETEQGSERDIAFGDADRDGDGERGHRESVAWICRAAATSPENVSYQGQYATLLLADIFFSTIGEMAEEDATHQPQVGKERSLMERIQQNPARRDTVQVVVDRMTRMTERYGSTYPVAYYYLGVARYLLGEYDASMRALSTAVARRPDLPELYALYCGACITCIGEGRCPPEETANRLYGIMVDACTNRRFGSACQLCGETALRFGDTAAAIDSYQRALFYGANAFEARFGIVEALMAEGRYGEAREWLAVAEREEGQEEDHNSLILQAKAVLAAVAGDRTLARALCERVLEDDDDCKEAKRLLEYLGK